MDIIKCPCCQTAAVAGSEGTCPSCGRALATRTPRLLAMPTIVAANVAVFSVMMLAGMGFLSADTQLLKAWSANYGPWTMDGQWWRLATNPFIHFGPPLIVNMVVLWCVGRLVERLVGSPAFALLYVVSGLAAGVATLAWHPNVVCAGASGAVFGVFGGLLGIVALRRRATEEKVAKHLLTTVSLFWGYVVVFGMRPPGTDHAAHVGGFVAGLLCGLALGQPLTLENIQNRRRRSLIVAGVAVSALLIFCAALPPAPPDVEAGLLRFVEVERKSLGLFNDLADRARRGEVGDPELADAIATKILAPWADMRSCLEALVETPNPRQAMVVELVDYMRQREKAWKMYVEALRENDSQKMERAQEVMKAAEVTAKKLSEQ